MRADDYDDGNRFVIITIGPIKSTDSAFQALSPMQVTCIVIDDDTFGVRVTTPQPPPLYIMEEHAREKENAVEVRFQLTSKPRENVFLHASVSDTTEAMFSPCRIPRKTLKRELFPLDCGSQQYNSYYSVILKYNTQNWDKIQALKIASEDDQIDDGPQIVQIGIVQVETKDRHYSALTKANLNVSAIVINLDDG